MTSYWIFRVSNENHATLYLGPLLELLEGRHWETGLNILEIGSDYNYSVFARKKQ